MHILVGRDSHERYVGQVKEPIAGAQWLIFDEVSQLPAQLPGDTVALLAGSVYNQEFKSYLTAQAGLKWVHTENAGISGEFYQALLKHGVCLTNSPGANAPEVAEFSLAMLLWSAKRLGQFQTQQQSAHWQRLPLQSLSDKTILVVGLGEIGSRVAGLAKAFGMRVLGIRRSNIMPPGVDELGDPAALRRFIPQADFVVLALPLSDSSKGLLGEQELALLPANATLINVARGEVIHMPALKQLLSHRNDLQFCLDVLPTEPLASDDPLWQSPNVLVTPHNAWSSPLYQNRVIAIWQENLKRYVAGKSLRHRIDLSDL